MARLIAVEWDAREARVVVARQRGKSLIFEHAFPVELVPADPGQTFGDTDVGDRVGAALSARGIGHSDALVTVGRTNIELRQLTLPPSPLDELPDLVRFQAMRQFANIGDGWPLDFAHIDSGDGHEFNVLAAAISPTLVEQICKVCEAGGLTPKHLVLRPFAAASLFRRFDAKRTDHCRLIVDPLAVEADLTVLVDEQVGFMRTVRLAEGDYQTTSLVQEIRRTIVAAQNQLAGRRVERIVLCGEHSDHGALKKLLEETLSLPVEVFDPFDGLAIEGDLAKRLPPNHGRFLPLLGMLMDEAAGAPHAIDFLNPTRRPEAPSNQRRNLLIAAAVAALFLAVVGGFWYQLHDLDVKARNLTAESNNMEQAVKIATQRRADVASVDEFLAGDITWLDELRDLSLAFPPPEQAMIQSLNATDRPKGGGHLRLNGFVSDSSVLDGMERQLRDERHSVLGTGGQYDPGRKVYPWRFAEENVLIEPEDHTGRFEATDAEPANTAAATDAASESSSNRGGTPS